MKWNELSERKWRKISNSTNMREQNSSSCILELKDEDVEVLEDCTSMEFKMRSSIRMALKYEEAYINLRN